MVPLTVVCVYSPGAGFTDEYVTRLKSAVEKNCSVPHRFVCITNSNLANVETIKRATAWRNWWIKLELFRPGLFKGPVVYFDLDTLILNDITDILTYPHDFSCPTNWKGGETHISSAIMAWDGREDLSHIYGGFHTSMIIEYEQQWTRWGDQGFIQDTLSRPFTSLQRLFPGRIVHYKSHCIGTTKEFPGKAPKGASIVCFSGTPRPHELNWILPHAN